MTQRSAPLASMTEHRGEDGVLVRLSGRLDRRTVADLRIGLHRLVVTTDVPVLLDLEDAVLGDACAVGLLVELRRLAQRSGTEVRVVAADPRSTRLLYRARLRGLLAPTVRPVLSGRLAGAV